MVRAADVLVFLDDVQYTRRDWRNRNLIRGASGPRWLTIPVSSKGQFHANIGEIEIADSGWRRSHLSILEHTYGHYAFYQNLRHDIASMYEEASRDTKLSVVNQRMTLNLFQLLDIQVEVYDSSKFAVHNDPSERLAAVCLELNACTYVSGPAARSYLCEEVFEQSGLTIEWIDYGQLPPIPKDQDTGKELSILDILSTSDLPTSQRLSTFVSSSDTA